jgi:integral membrane protein
VAKKFAAKALRQKGYITLMKAKLLLHWFRIVAIAEGISFLVLLGVAMPLKYFMDMPMAVKIGGYLHGFLFIAFVSLAWKVKDSLNKNFGWFAKALLASVLPFGTFVFDRSLKKEEQQSIIAAEEIV